MDKGIKIDLVGSAAQAVWTIVGILFTNLLIFALGVVSPILFLTIPFYYVAKNPGQDISTFSTAYLFFGPVASMIWMFLVARVYPAYRATKEGEDYESNLLACAGWLILGFFGSVLAEGLLVFASYYFGMDNSQQDRYIFFAIAPLAVFAPSLLYTLSAALRQLKTSSQDKQIEADRFARQYAIDVRRSKEKQAAAAAEQKWLKEIGVDAEAFDLDGLRY